MFKNLPDSAFFYAPKICGGVHPEDCHAKAGRTEIKKPSVVTLRFFKVCASFAFSAPTILVNLPGSFKSISELYRKPAFLAIPCISGVGIFFTPTPELYCFQKDVTLK